MNEPITEAPLPPANTQGEVNVHLGYIRRDLLDIKNQNAKDLKEIKDQIGNIGNHYVTQSEFVDIKKTVESNTSDIKDIYKKIYIAMGILAVLQFLAPYIINQLIK